MDPGPKVALSEFVLKIIDDESTIFSSSTEFSMEILRNGDNVMQGVMPSMSMMRNDNGCLVGMTIRLIVPAISIYSIDVFKVEADNKLKLGSVYVDLEDEDLLQMHGDLPHMYNVILESDNFPVMQFGLKASLFSPFLMSLQPIVSFLVFEICSEETTDMDFMVYAYKLDNLLSGDKFLHLLLPEEQFFKLWDRCLALGSDIEQCVAFLLFAEHVNNMFRAISPRQPIYYQLSRQLYNKFATIMGDINCPLQSFLFLFTNRRPHKILCMQSLGRFFIKRYSTMHNYDDLKQGISLLESVQQLRASSDFDNFSLDLLYMYESMYHGYWTRYTLSNNVLDLDLSLKSLDKAIKLSLPSWATPIKRSEILRALTQGLMLRYTHLGAEHDRERAMECVNEALMEVSVDSLEYLECLSIGLPSLFFSDFEDMGKYQQSLEILEKYIANAEDLESHEVKVAKGNLAILLFARATVGAPTYQYTVNTDQSDSLLSENCGKKKASSGREADIRRAIKLLRELVDYHPGLQAGNYRVLAASLMICFKWYGDQADLDEAIAILSNCKLASSFITPFIGLELGKALYLKYSYYGQDPKDLHSAISAVSLTATSVNVDSKIRFFAVQWWLQLALCLDGEDHYFIMMDAYKTAMYLIPSIVWIGMAMQDRHDILMSGGLRQMPLIDLRRENRPELLHSSISQFPNRAVSFAIKYSKVYTAIEWLEQGRSIIWNQLLQFRIPLDELLQKAPNLAKTLATLARDLSLSSTRTHFWKKEDGWRQKVSLEAEGQKHRKLATKWQEAVIEARKLPGLDKFLLPKDFNYLSNAADDGIIIIINISIEACDALIIFPGSTKEVRHVPLWELTIFDIEQMYADLMYLIRDDMGIRSAELARRPIRKHSPIDSHSTFQKILGNLWYKIVLPIICAAMEDQPILVNCDENEQRAHVRWCPTGQLAFLPLHAAGDYSSPERGHRVFDFIVSSYIPTLNSIIRSTSPTSNEEMIKVLAVACPYAKDQFPIPDTVEEVTRLERHIAPFLSQPTTSVSRYTAFGKKISATAERVLEEMKQATWVHLACHGVQDATSPTSSALLLSNGTRLLLSDIASLDLPQAEFAFLSACQTATGYDKVPSESIHLAAGMLLAGYRSVIGTMWSIADRHAPDVADDVYGYLLRDGTSRRPDYKESALALHLAMEKLRMRIGEELFLKWVPYIHIGA